MYKTLFILSIIIVNGCLCLNNGVGDSVVFGWTTGERYNCMVDCDNYPEDCISEHLVKTVADMLTLSSFSRSGYRYIVLGDCWMDMERDRKGRLMGDTQRFPSGMANLVSYLHSKNLKLGLQVDLGNLTCGGYPGSIGHYDLDAQTLADWGVAMVKAEACGIVGYSSINTAYTDFGMSLNKTGVRMIYDCGWPVWLDKKGGGRADFVEVAKTCNFFRIVPGTVTSSESLSEMLTQYASSSYLYEGVLGPGSYIDFDQLTIGTSILSVDQERFHLAFWAIMRSPLLVSCDLTTLRTSSKQLLLNKQLIDIATDPLATVAKKQLTEDMVSIWTKPILSAGSWVVALFNTNIVGLPSQISFQLSRIGLVGAGRYNVTEVFTGDHYGVVKPWYYFNCQVEASSVLLLRFIAI